ncbi:Golgi-associated RAB2 interactor protein 1A-like isoform X2 [Macrotis lagotis]|uniref:Golgi-associated RAB2 interactor protein 1A-like isoform X2 n=1 Tax=Macrotis lagotis TaxID=92651 RepID=UPI003D682B88
MVDESYSRVGLGVEEGLLSKLLHSPEFNLFPSSAIFESNFIQVTNHEDWIDAEDRSTAVILGVTSSVPSLPLPNIFLMAKVTWPQGHLSPWTKPINVPTISLSRIVPLKFVEITVYDKSQRILRVRTVTERIYYMKLHPKHSETVFHLWIHLVNILQKDLSITTKDPRIHVNRCLVPQIPSTTFLEEEYDPSNPRSSDNLKLLMAIGTHETTCDLSIDLTPQKDQLNSNSSKTRETEIKGDTKYNSGTKNPAEAMTILPKSSKFQYPKPKPRSIRPCGSHELLKKNLLHTGLLKEFIVQQSRIQKEKNQNTNIRNH